jgi:hypothetical protein
MATPFVNGVNAFAVRNGVRVDRWDVSGCLGAERKLQKISPERNFVMLAP